MWMGIPFGAGNWNRVVSLGTRNRYRWQAHRHERQAVVFLPFLSRHVDRVTYEGTEKAGWRLGLFH